MNVHKRFAVSCSFSCLTLLLSASYMSASDKYTCAEPNPEKMCNPGNTCGSASTPCTIDIKRRGSNSASSTPSIPNAKANALFCVQAGTDVKWVSSSKDTGFVVDFGPSSPFDPPGAIMGGTDRPITVAAKRPGCFKYSAGACTSGTIYGMCGSVDTELVVTSPAK